MEEAVLEPLKGHIWQLRDVSSNCAELRWLQGTFMTFLKAATFGICYRVFSEIASIQSGFTAHGGDTSLSTGWVDLTYFGKDIEEMKYGNFFKDLHSRKKI